MTVGAFELRQTSDPAGIIDLTSELPPDSAVSTVTAPAVSTTYRFTHWTLNGVRANIPAGDAANPVNFTLTTAVDAVAHYLPYTQDRDADGLPDWWELHYFSNLSQLPTDNPDSDAYDNLAEYLNDTHPLLANQSDDRMTGGLSRTRTEVLYLIQNAATQVRLRETSLPPGAVNQTRIVAKGAPVTLSTPPSPMSGWRFTGWLLNGTRFDTNAAVQPITILPLVDMEMVARYTLESLDSDDDGEPDWKEWLWYEALANDATSDTDGDGFTWAQEDVRGFCPIAADTLAAGGLSRSRTPVLYAQTSGQLAFRQTSTPATILEQTDSFASGTVIAVPDKTGLTSYGYKFAWWDLNGVRQTNASGASVGTFTFTLTTPSTATAHYIDPTVDTDNDGILDWYEWNYYGSLEFGPNDDTDGDGFTFAQEIARGQSPQSVDTLMPGGLSRTRASLVAASATPRLAFHQTSNPATIIEQTDYYAPGTVITVPDKTGKVASNYQFAWWDLDGTRQQDASGVALGTFSFVLNQNSMATAHYVDPTLDTDGDGIPDWHEWTYYGNLAQNATSDTDDDGFNFAQEIARAQSPRVADLLVHGGISRTRCPALAAQLMSTPIAPGIGAITITNLTTNSAHVSAMVNPANSASTAYFQYGTTIAYGRQTPADVVLNGFSPQAMSAILTGLLPGTICHFRIVVTNGVGTTVGVDYSFRTLGLAPTGYEAWQAQWGVGSLLADDDHDGLNNLLEYAFGLDPLVADVALLPKPERMGDRYRLRCTDPVTGGSGLIYGAQWSTDCVTWVAMTDVGLALNHEFWTPAGAAVHGRIFARWTIEKSP